MLKISNVKKYVISKKALKAIEELPSDRQTEKAISQLERSKSENDRIQAIFMRSILNGNTEESFRKACKTYEKTCKEHVRVA